MSARESLRLPASFVVLAWTTALGQSFDCAKAVAADEKLICATPSLRELDSKFAAQYRRVRAAVTPKLLPELTADQKRWLQKRQECTGESATAKDCMERAYRDRSQYFTALLSIDDDARRSSLRTAILQGQWRVGRAVVPERGGETVDVPARVPLPDVGSLLKFAPGSLCTPGRSEPCSKFGLEVSAMRNTAAGERRRKTLDLAPDSVILTGYRDGRADFTLIPMPDGRIFAVFPLCETPRMRPCVDAFQVWEPAGKGAALKLLP